MRKWALLAALLVTLGLSACGGGGGGDTPDRPPVVVLVFDEFPADTLLRPDGSIDAERYPHFADLAAHSTWFPNAFTVYDSTFKAVPLIQDAVFPKRGTAADYRSHPRSVYHLMNRLGYGVVDVESGESLCPPRICPGARSTRPGVLKRLAGGGRPARLHAWIGAIRKRDRPTFYFQHALLPHEPWIYLPSGRQSRPKGNDPIPKINGPVGFHDQALTNHNETRHLLQVGFVDRQVGLVLDRLRRTGLFDQALIVVTADHGIAFMVGVDDRRLVTDDNVEQVAPVPMFVKAPGQTDGEVDRSLMRTLDVTPTIADLLHTKPRWRHDGALRLRPGDPPAPRGGAAHPRLQRGDPDQPAGDAPAPRGQPAAPCRSRGHGGRERPALRLALGAALPGGIASRAGGTAGERATRRGARAAQRQRGQRRPAPAREP